ncbi:MAG: nodulation protein S NodS [Candidatus Marinimicrobia bacterium]|nr:nodulation protein S NodS [Candidatus Neomarinimicrobiota bacterium]|tara:strand:+ start:13597 stop:14211 length:615 start_codon:yes stop_codon:yes gene_type:complete
MNINIKTFNEWAEDGRDEKMALNHSKSVNRILSIISQKTNKFKAPFSFLDLGCGNGWVIRKISKKYKCEYALGVDGSVNMINNAKKNKIGEFKKVDLENYKFDRKFDIIFSMETFYYLKNINKLFKKIAKDGLNENGILIIGIDHYKENIPSLNWGSDYNLDISTLSTNDWIEKFILNGFKNVEYEYYGTEKDWKGTLILMGQR